VNYQVVFDIADVGYKNWTGPAFGLIFVAIGILLVANRKNLPGQWSNYPLASSAFAFFWLGFSVFVTLTMFYVSYTDYSSLSSARSAGQARIVHGPVRDFVPMPVTGHAMERFCVTDECFEYSDYVATAGFNNTSSHGGPIKEGLQVRVTYVGNSIIRLEVAR
jgi:hypothetical protein